MRLTFINFAKIPEVFLDRPVKIGKETLRYSNLPERYIKRCMEQVYWVTPKLPNYRQCVEKRDKNHFDQHRAWTREFQKLNEEGRYHRKYFVEPIKDWSFFLGDRVEILVGRDKGKQGVVKEIIQERNWVFVEGCHTYLTRIGKTKAFPGILQQLEMPLVVNREVALVDPTDLKPTKAEWRFTEDGKKVRVSERTGRAIPVPVTADETYDYKVKSGYQENDKDTKADELQKITFAPSLQTFEMEIMEQEGIVEIREEGKTYWY